MLQRLRCVMSDQRVVEVAYSVQQTTVKKKRSRLLSRSSIKLLGATVCIAGAVASWLSMAEVLQKLNKVYKKPFFMVFFAHSSYVFLYLGWSLWRNFPYCFSKSFSCNKVGDGALGNSSHRALAVASGVLSLVSLLSVYAWYLSLTRTNIPANTAIYQCSAAIVFIISVPLLKERVTFLKVFCVVVSVGGVFMVAFFSTNSCSPNNISNSTNTSSFHDDKGCKPAQETSTPLGYVFLVVSVITYALYETLYKKFATKKDDPAATLNGLRFLGYMGIHTLFWQWPLLLILHFSKFETFEVPPSMELFGFLVLNAFMDILFNSCLLVCIALSSPLYASVCTIVAIPLSVVVDLVVQHFLPSWVVFVGIVLILIGFIGFVISEFIELRREAKHQRLLQADKLKNTAGSDTTGSGDVGSESNPLLNKLPGVDRERNRYRRFIIKHLV